MPLLPPRRATARRILTLTCAVCLATTGRAVAFDPELAVTIDATAYDDSRDGDGDQLLNELDGAFAGHGHGDEPHGLEQGLNLRPTELSLAVEFVDGLDGRLTAAIGDAGDIELEEAFAAADLWADLQLKAGRFYSGIGYQNERHRHTWSFVDQNLAYRSLIGEHGLSDTGLQLTWEPPTAWPARFGVEAFRGDFDERLGMRPDHRDHLPDRPQAPRLWTAFVETSPQLGDGQELHLGMSAAFFRSHQEVHNEDEPAEHALDGTARLLGVEAVYRLDAGRPGGAGDWQLAAEYLRADKHLDVVRAADPTTIGAQRDFAEDGLYVQAVYGLTPNWDIGLRFDAAGLINRRRGDQPATDSDYGDSRRWTAATTWHVTENSHLRAQVGRVDAALEAGRTAYTQFYLQYQWRFSLGHRHRHVH